MSRIGKQPIPVPTGVTVTIEPEVVRVSGPRGNLEERKPRDIAVEQQDSELIVTRPTNRGEHRALHGLTRSLIFNMVQGGMGTTIVSTSKGVMTGHEAKRQGVGGEVVAYVW